MAQVYKSANGKKWVIRFYYDGKKVEVRDPRSVGFPESFWDTELLTQRKMTKLAEAVQLRYGEIAEKKKEEEALPNRTMADLARDFLNYKETLVNWTTYMSTRSQIRHITGFYGNERIRDCLTRDGLSKFREHIASADLGMSMKNGVLKRFSEMIRYFSMRGYASAEILNASEVFLKPMKAERTVAVTERDFWTVAEWEQFMSVFTEEKDFVWKVIFEVTYWCALRKGEVLGLKFSDFDFNAKTVYIQRQRLISGKLGATKTASSTARVAVRSEVLEDVKKLREMCPGEEFICPVGRTSLDGKFESYIKKAGVKHIVYHGLRHSMATRMFWKGYNATQVCHHLRHANPSVTMTTYVHFIPTSGNDYVDML